MANIVDWLRTTISPAQPLSKPTNIEDDWELFENIADPEEIEDTHSSIHTIEHIKLAKSTMSETSSKKFQVEPSTVTFPIPLSVIESTIHAINAKNQNSEEKSPRASHKPPDTLAKLKDKELKYRKLNKRNGRR